MMALALPLVARAADDAASAASELSAYDAGYASEASVGCPGLVLIPAIAEATKADSNFKRGQDMFRHYVEAMKAEEACKAALRLYDERTGKVAKILGHK